MASDSGNGVTELELMNLAEKIDVNTWRKLGLWLDIREAALSKYERENWFSGAASIGTYKMLCDWRKNCHEIDQRDKLTEALQRCEIGHLAKEVLKHSPRGLYGPEIIPIRDKLISYAKTKLLRIPLIPWAKKRYIQVDSIFICVQLILHIVGPDIPVRCPLESYNDILTENIAEESSDLPSKRFIVRGKAGSGKTTLLIKLLSDWCKEVAGALLAKFKLVLFLPMRKLTFQSNLGEAILQYCLPRDASISAGTVEQMCRENSKDVCVLLDGYDEFPGKGLIGEGAGNIVSMLRNDEFIDIHVIITTRPGRLEDFLEYGEFKHLEVTGFTQEHVHEYISKTFTGARQRIGTNLYAYLDGNNLLAEVSSVPLLLCAFCQVARWTDGIEFGKLSTYTALFQTLVRCFFEHQLAKPKAAVSPTSSPDKIEEKPIPIMTQEFLFDQLGKVALLGFFREKDGELLFSEEDFDKCTKSPSEVIDQGCIAGLITRDDDVSADPWEEQSCIRNISFVLKTVQEMFAGRYLARLFALGESELFRHYLHLVDSVQRILDLTNVLMFACGQSLEVAEEIIVHVVNHIVEEDRESIQRFWSGQLPISECRRVQEKIELCLNLNYESQCRGQFNKHLQPIFHVIRLFSPPQRTARTLGYMLQHSVPSKVVAFPTKNGRRSECDYLVSTNDDSSGCHNKSSAVDQGSNKSDEKVHVDDSSNASDGILAVRSLEIIHVNEMFDDQFRQIRDFLPKVKKDFFQNVNNLAMMETNTWSSIRNRLTTKSPADFEDIDHLSDNQFVAYLPVKEEMKKWQVNEIYLDGILTGLRYCSVETLVITGIARRSQKWRDLFDALSSPEWRRLVKLDLSRNNLSSVLMSLLGRALVDKPNLQHFDVSGNEIKKSFVSLIPSLPSLRRIYLNSEHMEPQTLAEFGGKLAGFPNIEVIDLNDNPLDDTAAAEIGDALRGCTKLQRLRLDVSKVSEGGISRMVAKIKFVPSLTHIGLYKHHNADALVKSVTSSLNKLPKIMSLSLTCREDDELPEDLLSVRLSTTQSFTRAITALPKLQVLELFKVRLCARGLVGLLDVLSGMETLQEFRVAAGYLTDDQEAEEACRNAQQTFLKVY
ncbi:NLR family CARD domain-containing protein 4-like [Lytechinus pictus]|uniref:NLR family CARD domain-containing protein 4-like n=1 Tax=Lytechinus pictus TaxID=7653 RepID=UPI0030BA2548